MVRIDPHRYYAIKEISAYFEVADMTLVRAIERGDIAAARIMQNWRIKGEWVLDFEKRVVAQAEAIRKSRQTSLKVRVLQKAQPLGPQPMRRSPSR